MRRRAATLVVIAAAVTTALVAARQWSAAEVQRTVPARESPARAELLPSQGDGRRNAIEEGHTAADTIQTSRVNDPPPGSAAPVARLSLTAPALVAPGDTVDLFLGGSANRLVGRIVLKIQFDPSLLRLRSNEEIDYTNANVDPAQFVVETAEGGEITVTADAAGQRGLGTAGRQLGIVQFEAIARGWARVDAVASAIVDRSGKTVDASLVPNSVQVAIN
jgi:hypothetical protein